MPSRNCRRCLSIAAIAVLLIAGFCLIQWRNSSKWSVKFYDGSTFTIVDFAKAPGEEMYIGVPWKRPVAELFKHSNPSFKRNFGHTSVTNESAISWQHSNIPKLQLGLTLYDRIKLVDAQGVEHNAERFFSFGGGAMTASDMECGIMTFSTSLKPPAFLRVYQGHTTNEFRLEK